MLNKKSMNMFYFVRHPQSMSNVKNIWCSTSNPKLSKVGLQQCFSILKDFANLKIDIIYSSPKIRAITLAKMIAKQKKVKLIVDEKLVERDFGKLEGCVTKNEDKEVMSNWELNSNLDKDVEPIQDMFFKRVKPRMDKIIHDNVNKNILLVGHSWWGRLIRLYFSKDNDNSSILITPKNGEILKFNIDNDKDK